MKKTKIICTIGPATASYQTLKEMAKAGMSIARLNFSHGDHQTHLSYLQLIRKLNKETNFNIKILQDLEGFRIRVGKLDRPIQLNSEKFIKLTPTKLANSQLKVIPLDYDNLSQIPIGTDIFIDDGNIQLRVTETNAKQLIAKVINPGLVYSNKGVNIPSLQLKRNIITSKDIRDIEFAVENKIDLIAQSFVRNALDIKNLYNILQKKQFSCPIIAKIENRAGIENIKQILPLADGIMIARGDMGVLLPIYEVPVRQKQILQACKQSNKFSIVATQMLESMKENLKPTRAEVSDVANAVWDGADYVMLSAETAVGKYPVETVKLMQQIIEYSDEYRD
jgi:pyruvate kinase